MLAYCGIDPLLFVDERDSERTILMQKIAERVKEIKDIELNNQAVLIAREVSKLFKKS